MELVGDWENDSLQLKGLSGVVNEYRADCPVDGCDGQLRVTCPEEYELCRIVDYETDQEWVFDDLPSGISPRYVSLDRETCNGEARHELGVKTFDPDYDER